MSGSRFTKIEGERGLYRYVSDGPKNGLIYLRTRVNGRNFERPLGTKHLRNARFEAEKLKASQRRLNPDGQRMTVLALIRDYGASRGGRNRGGFANITSKLEGKSLSSTLISKVTELEVGKWLGEVSVGANSHNKYFSLLKSALAFAVRQKWLVENPLQHAKLRKKHHRKKPFAPTPEQFEKLCAAVLSNKYYSRSRDSYEIIKFCGYFGIYLEEACLLEWSSVNFETNRLKVYRPKTDKEYTVPIFPYCRKFLHELWESRGRPRRGTIFAKVKKVDSAIHGACERLGYHYFTITSFRQMFVVRLYRQRVQIKQISNWIGHSDGGVLVLRRYSEVFQEIDDEFEHQTIEKVC